MSSVAKPKALFCWSGGKDSSLALYRVLKAQEYEIVALLTTISAAFQRVSMHGVREELVEQQAISIGLPLVKMYISEGTNDEYERNMEELLLRFKQEGVETVIFGDIFLEELRQYRDSNLAKVGMKGVYPLWKEDTDILLKEFLASGFQTIVCCTNDTFLGREWVGRMIDDSFIHDLPATVDPCGENGEYHTFCFNGPIFTTPILIETGEKIYKPLEIKTDETCPLPAQPTQGFWFCDLLSIEIMEPQAQS